MSSKDIPAGPQSTSYSLQSDAFGEKEGREGGGDGKGRRYAGYLYIVAAII